MSETFHKILGIFRVIHSLAAEFVIVIADRKITAIRKREWVETLRSTAERIERLPEGEF